MRTQKHRSQKGLVRILEAIIASIVMLASLTFFFVPQPRPVTDDTLLVVQAADALATLDKSGRLVNYIVTDDRVHMNGDIKNMTPSASDFSVSVVGLPPPRIYVACICTVPERDALQDLIQGTFQYRERTLEIIVYNYSIESMPAETDIAFYTGYTNLNPYNATISKFLSGGGSIFMLSDLSQSQAEDGFMNDTFGLRWEGSPVLPGLGAGFYNITNSTEPSFRVFRYYDNITQVTDDIGERYTFTKFHAGNTIKKSFGAVAVNGNVAMVHAKSSGAGRALWFADFDRTDPDGNETAKMAGLLRASVMWDSGEKYSMDSVLKVPGAVHGTASYLVAGTSTFEPFVVELTVWKIFL